EEVRGDPIAGLHVRLSSRPTPLSVRRGVLSALTRRSGAPSPPPATSPGTRAPWRGATSRFPSSSGGPPRSARTRAPRRAGARRSPEVSGSTDQPPPAPPSRVPGLPPTARVRVLHPPPSPDVPRSGPPERPAPRGSGGRPLDA